MAKAMDVAKYLIHLRDIDEAEGQYYSLSNLKLQKLLYYCQGGHYRWDDEKLIEDRAFEAWPYGPVIPEVYKNFKKYGQSDVYLKDTETHLSNVQRETIQAVWEQLKERDAFSLVESSHSEAPWENSKESNCLFISEKDIKEYFQEDGIQ